MTTINDLSNKITILFEKYKDDEIILNKLINHINKLSSDNTNLYNDFLIIRSVLINE